MAVCCVLLFGTYTENRFEECRRIGRVIALPPKKKIGWKLKFDSLVLHPLNDWILMPWEKVYYIIQQLKLVSQKTSSLQPQTHHTHAMSHTDETFIMYKLGICFGMNFVMQTRMHSDAVTLKTKLFCGVKLFKTPIRRSRTKLTGRVVVESMCWPFKAIN